MEQQITNEEMNLAWQFIAETNVSVFLTGKAGTGKTTFLRKLRERVPKRMVVLAPTGVAAINANGQTIHSFFQLPFGPMVPGAQAERSGYFKVGKDKKNLIRTLDLLVIDEISMVRCDLLDAIDTELRKYRDRTKPFGGVQLLMIGDLQQLAPVAKESEWALLAPYYSTPYFFGSKALQEIRYVTIELKRIYRQTDASFIDILGKVRNNKVDEATLNALNSRYIPDFTPPEGEDWIRLTTHNNMAHNYNESRLDMLTSPAMTFQAEVKGNFPETSYPADQTLVLKIGAQVMFIKNDPTVSHAYYNGKIGTVRGRDDEGNILVWCKEDGKMVAVGKAEWENTKYVIDEATKAIKEEVEGEFRQYPLRLAWAITVHKSQGLTFDHAVLDVNSSFTHGQTYVALSRCRTLEGMVLARPMDARSVITDASVNDYIDRELSEARTAVENLPTMRMEYYLMLLDEMFSFRELDSDYRYLVRVVDEHLYGSYPEYLSLLKEKVEPVTSSLIGVSAQFRNQYMQILQQEGLKSGRLAERLNAASGYFSVQLEKIFSPVMEKCVIQIGNKQVSTQYNNALDAFKLSLKVKSGVFRYIGTEGFSVKGYLSAKAKSLLDELSVGKTSGKKTTKTKEPKEKKEKREKGDSHRMSLQMYRDGKSIEDIAKERGLTSSTIEGHLASFVESGELDINDVVSTQHQKFIRGVVKSFDRSYTLKDVKDLLPPDYTYGEVKLVIADMNK